MIVHTRFIPCAIYLVMMPFSTGTGLERDEIVGPELDLPLGQSASPGCCTLLQKQVTKGDRRGFARCLSDAKVSSSLVKE